MSCKSWTYPETQALLDIWQQDHIQTQLTLMARNRPVWEQVAEIMRFRKGFTRTGEQCKTRIHTLKIRYNRAKKFGLSGPEAEKECPFYRQLDAVLGKNWVNKTSYSKGSASTAAAAALSTSTSITSLYPLTFASDLENSAYNMGKSGMIQILPKPIPKYGESPFKNFKVQEDKIGDILGEHLIKKVISGLARKDQEGDDSVLMTTSPSSTEGESQFNELLKSLVSAGSALSDRTAFKSPSSIASTSPMANSTSPTTATNAMGISNDNEDTSSLVCKRRKTNDGSVVSEMKTESEATEQNLYDRVVLFGTLSQIDSKVTDLSQRLKLAQENENKKIRDLMEMQERRADMEREHYNTVKDLLSSLIQAMNKTGVETTSLDPLSQIKVESK